MDVVIKAIKYGGLLKAAIDGMPIPFWVKDKSSKMILINTAYTQVFGVKKEEYVGKYDVEVWGEELGRAYQEHDQVALKSETPVHFKERVKVKGNLQFWDVCKFSYVDALNNTCIAGYALPIGKNKIDI